MLRGSTVPTWWGQVPLTSQFGCIVPGPVKEVCWQLNKSRERAAKCLRYSNGAVDASVNDTFWIFIKSR